MRYLLRRCVLCLLCAAPVSAQHSAEMQRAIQEFEVQTRGLEKVARGTVRQQAPAQRWHGRVYEYFRNDFLDAIPHEVVQRGGTKSVLRRNQFGFSLSGPVAIPGTRRGSPYADGGWTTPD